MLCQSSFVRNLILIAAACVLITWGDALAAQEARADASDEMAPKPGPRTDAETDPDTPAQLVVEGAKDVDKRSKDDKAELNYCEGGIGCDDDGGGGGGGGGGHSPTDTISLINSLGIPTNLENLNADLLGDTIDIDTGALSFRHVDVSLPGNSNLPVQFGRRWSRNLLAFDYRYVMGGWDLDLPYITHRKGTFGYNAPLPGGAGNPCSSPSDLYNERRFWSHFWNGVNMYIPGHATRPLLRRTSSGEFQAPLPTKVTKDGWIVHCPSYGFTVTAPNGDKYTFDRLVNLPGDTYDCGFNCSTRTNNVVYYPSEVRDVHGNWVRYIYNAYGPTRIYSNDGRRIDIYYSGKRIDRVVANGRTWRYVYSGSTSGPLWKVIQPDGRYWLFESMDSRNQMNNKYMCRQYDPYIKVTHPYGVVGHFDIAPILNGRTDLPNFYGNPYDFESGNGNCVFESYTLQPHYYSHGVTRKRLVVGGAGTYTWQYQYEQDHGEKLNVFNLPDTKKRTVIDPTGRKIVSHVNRSWTWREGLLERREIYASASSYTPLQTVVYTHVVGHTVGVVSKPSPQTGATPQNDAPQNTAIYQTRQVITRGSDRYTTDMIYSTNPAASNYSYGLPLTVRSYSTVSSGTRESVSTYSHNKSKWVLGLQTLLRRNGKEFERHGYDSLGRRTWTNSFGVRTATFGYHTASGQRGALAWSRDAINRTTYFDSYKRGKPTQVRRPDGTRLRQTVDNNGWTLSETNARNYTTSYQHDSMGRLTRITPSKLDGASADTVISYSFYSTTARVTSTKAKHRTTAYLDGMLRPYLSRQQDLNSGGQSIYTRTRFDADSRIVFESFPSTSSVASTGRDTVYDALSRIKSIRENVYPYATTTFNYLSANRRQSIDALQNVTTVRSSGYGSPDDGDVTLMQQPLGVTTSVSRDIYGNMTAARQYGNHNGYNVDHTQRYYYDGRLRLCRHSVPESGDTLFQYDNANQLVGVGRLQVFGSGCASLPAAAKVARTYDAMGRVRLVNFPDSAPDISYSYDADGFVTRVLRGTADWTYRYNDVDLLVEETLKIDGRTYRTGYSYNTGSHLVSQTTPDLRSVTYAPDGFGRATKASVGGTNYASSVRYHPSGHISQFAYGNGHQFTQTLNSRQQIANMRVEKGGVRAMYFTFGYDKNNRITAINDYAVSGRNRTFSYDALGRLVGSNGPWGSGSFVYDPLGNIRRKTLGSQVVQLQYDGNNRVSRIHDSAATFGWRSYAYDQRGNTVSDGRMTFVYDRADQPRSIYGSATGSFVYDGNLKRAKQTINGKTIYSVYSKSGALLFRDKVNDAKRIDYIRAAGKGVVRLVNGVPTYAHGDHLGSPVSATNSSGTIVWREHYTPYGSKRQDPSANRDDEGFAGHVDDSATQLTYMQARYYDPLIGRFLSIDPVDFNPMQPETFNRYAYASNDPINRFDPDGKAALWKRFKNAGGVIRNVGLAGKTHPVTKIPFDKNGFPVFNSVSKRNVQIKMTGDNYADFKLANRKAGFDSTPSGYSWHHHQDGKTMQLVPSDIHHKTGHTGGAGMLRFLKDLAADPSTYAGLLGGFLLATDEPALAAICSDRSCEYDGPLDGEGDGLNDLDEPVDPELAADWDLFHR